jgi:hypothetical protein
MNSKKNKNRLGALIACTCLLSLGANAQSNNAAAHPPGHFDPKPLVAEREMTQPASNSTADKVLANMQVPKGSGSDAKATFQATATNWAKEHPNEFMKLDKATQDLFNTGNWEALKNKAAEFKSTNPNTSAK